jgi:hypothetical protein
MFEGAGDRASVDPKARIRSYRIGGISVSCAVL